MVLGGLGSVKGTLLGGIMLGVVESLGGAFFGDGYRDFIGFVAFLVILSIRPQGLFGRRCSREPHRRRRASLVIVAAGALVGADAGPARLRRCSSAYEIAQLAALAQAWNLMAGYGGLVSLAVAAFVGIGAYATSKLSISSGFGMAPSVLAGGVFATIFALLVSVPMFRFRGLYFTIGSLVLASALRIFMVNCNGLGGNAGPDADRASPRPRPTSTCYALGAAAIASLLDRAGAARARLGLGLMAVRDDEDVAERVGVATFRTKLVGVRALGAS